MPSWARQSPVTADVWRRGLHIEPPELWALDGRHLSV